MHRKMGRQRYNKDKCKIRETDRWINKPDRERGIWHGQTKTDRQAGRWTDTWIGTETGRRLDSRMDKHEQADRQTDIKTYRQTDV